MDATVRRDGEAEAGAARDDPAAAQPPDNREDMTPGPSRPAAPMDSPATTAAMPADAGAAAAVAAAAADALQRKPVRQLDFSDRFSDGTVAAATAAAAAAAAAASPVALQFGGGEPLARVAGAFPGPTATADIGYGSPLGMVGGLSQAAHKSPVAKELRRYLARSSPKPASKAASEGTPRRKACNCKNSKCLKLYCECFAAGIYCSELCNCKGCQNNIENESVRQEAVESTLERNPHAFRPKVACSPASAAHRGIVDDVLLGELAPHGEAVVGRHNKGCHCKRTGCLKRYCECFQAGVPCSDNCRCVDCKNYDGSDERLALLALRAHPAYSPMVGPPRSAKRPRVGAADVQMMRSPLRMDMASMQVPLAAMASYQASPGMHGDGQAMAAVAAAAAAAAAAARPAGGAVPADAARALKGGAMAAAVAAAAAAGVAAAADGELPGQQLAAGGVQATPTGAKVAGAPLASSGSKRGGGVLRSNGKLPKSLLRGVIKDNAVEELSSLLLMQAQEQAAEFRRLSAELGEAGGVAGKRGPAAAEDSFGGQQTGRAMSPDTMRLLCDEEGSLFPSEEPVKPEPAVRDRQEVKRLPGSILEAQESAVLEEVRLFLNHILAAVERKRKA